MTNIINSDYDKKIYYMKKDGLTKYAKFCRENLQKFTNKNFCNMHRYKCISCDTRIKSNKLCRDHIDPKCKHEKCNKNANYRKLKVGNCTFEKYMFRILCIS